MRDRGKKWYIALRISRTRRTHGSSVYPILTPLYAASGEEASRRTSPGRNASPRGNKHQTKNGTMWVLGRKSVENTHTHTHNALPFPPFLPTVCYRHPGLLYFPIPLYPPLLFIIVPFIPSSSPSLSPSSIVIPQYITFIYSS